MNGPSQFPIPLNLSGLTVLAVLLLAVLLETPELQSDRPRPAEILAEPSGPFERVPARLWEDPFEAVRSATGSDSGESATGTGGRDGPCFSASATRSDGGQADSPGVEVVGRVAPCAGQQAPQQPRCDVAQPTARDVLYCYLQSLSESTDAIARTRLLILPVLVSASPHAEVRERRLRIRMAVHAGLVNAKFVPLRGDRIGDWLWQPGVHVPFEAFYQDVPAGDDDKLERRWVLLLWLGDELISQDRRTAARAGEREGPFCVLSRMLADMGYRPGPDAVASTTPEARCPTGSAGILGFKSTAIRALGPASSDSLKAYLNELKGWGGQVCANGYASLAPTPFSASKPPAEVDGEASVWGNCPAGFKLISPMATAPAKNLVGVDVEHEWRLLPPSGQDAAAGTSAWIALHRTISTDDRLIESLVDEMAVRGIDPSRPWGRASMLAGFLTSPRWPAFTPAWRAGDEGSRDHIVLVSEWDTEFGRTLPDLFVETVKSRYRSRCLRRDCGRCSLSDSEVKAWIHRFTLADLFLDTPESRYRSRCWRDDHGKCKLHKSEIRDWIHGSTLPDVFMYDVALGNQPGCWPDYCFECGPPGSAVEGGWIHRFSYTRGLDGQRSSGSTARTAGDHEPLPDVAALLAGSEGGLSEPAVGTYQLDYLRRLSGAIEALDRRLRRENRGSIRAFGILGSDYYDKLLILAALKERFPSQVYFTTDLDARWITRKTYRWARNLIIAAPFDLSLSIRGGSGNVQGSIAPFRDSYQTSLFLATMRTVKGEEAELVDDIKASDPLIFEVGRGGFYQLSAAAPDGSVQDPAAGSGPARSASSVQPAPWSIGIVPYLRNHVWTLLLVALAAGLWGLWMTVAVRARVGSVARTLGARVGSMAARARRDAGAGEDVGVPDADRSAGRRQDDAPSTGAGTGRARGFLRRHPYLSASVPYLAATVLLLAWAYVNATAEPFAWLAGVSIWPSEIIRVLAGGIAVLLLIAGWRRISETDAEIHCRYFKPPADPSTHDDDGQDAKAQAKGGFAAWFTRGRREPSCGRRALDHDTCPPDCRQPPASIARLLGDSTPMTVEQREKTRAYQEWTAYRRHADFWARAKRIVPAVVLFWLLAVLAVWGFDTTPGPFRGGPALVVDTVIALGLLGLPLLTLLFAALDEAQLCVGLLRHLEQARGDWPLPLMSPAAGADQGGQGGTGEQIVSAEAESAGEPSPDASLKAIGDLVAVEVIARRTDAAEYIIHLPFIVILFVMLSLSTWLDKWATPFGLLGLIVTFIAIGLISSLWLRRVAMNIRRAVLDDLSEAVEGIQYEEAKSTSAQLGLLRKRIESVRRGAYAKWYQEPVIQSVAWVIGIGVMLMTEYMRLGG